MHRVDPRPWNLLAASGLALAGCWAADADEDYFDSHYYDDDWGSYGCQGWNDCELGYLCVDQECEPAHEPSACMPSTLVEVPLPALEPSLAIAFVDLDGDGGDELVSIGAAGTSVVFADDTVVLTPWPATHDFEWLTVLELHDDAHLDLAVGFPLGMLLLRGTGDGGFLDEGTLESLPDIAVARAIDFDGDGIDQLAAAPKDGGGLLWFSDVDDGVWQPLEHPASTLTIANVWDPPYQDEILASHRCALTILQSTGFQFGWTLEGARPEWRCDWYVGAFASLDPALLAVATDTDTPLTQLTVFDPDSRMGMAAVVLDFHARTSTMIDLEGAGEAVLALGGDSSLALVGDWDRSPDPCVELLDEPADEVAAGDRDGDGRQELAVLHEGALRLLQLP